MNKLYKFRKKIMISAIGAALILPINLKAQETNSEKSSLSLCFFALFVPGTGVEPVQL